MFFFFSSAFASGHVAFLENRMLMQTYSCMLPKLPPRNPGP